MKCPMCGGDFDTVAFKTSTGTTVYAKRCTQCGGFWFEREPTERLLAESVAQSDQASANYSLKNIDLVCPNDQSLLQEAENSDLPAGGRYWSCPDCDGTFYPKGQLALIADWRLSQIAPVTKRVQTALGVVLIGALAILLNATLRQVQGGQLGLEAAEPVLPTAGPNLLTLALLSLTYLAGTALAVLGRRLPIVVMGWGVIAICLVGFFVIIFGP